MQKSTAKLLHTEPESQQPSPDGGIESVRTCRFCAAPLIESFVDLGTMPPANYYLWPGELGVAELFYPLHSYVCGDCHLVQIEKVQTPEQLFSYYAYFSSYSASWVEHARRFSEQARDRFGLGPDSLVVEVASNDGYLLRHFKRAGIPVFGVEPAANVAAVAKDAGIETAVRFFGRRTAQDLVHDGRAADLLVGNNVLAHVPDLNGFVAALAVAVKPEGVISLEFPHLIGLMEQVQFDTIYHEHYSYFSLLALEPVFARHGLRVFDVESLATHGGSLRLTVCRGDSAGHGETAGLAALRAAERDAGLHDLAGYLGFAKRVAAVKQSLLGFLEGARGEGKTVAAYGAAAKGNTLLNYCGVGADSIEYVVDASPHKQGRYLPGSRLPIYGPEKLAETRPDYVLILPWNLKEEICRSMAVIRQWGGQFIVPIPVAEVIT